jgi:peptidyl-prolyl cis-trans isomerase C
MDLRRLFVFLAAAACLSAQTPAPHPAVPAAPPTPILAPGTPAVTAPVPPDKVVLAVGDEKLTVAEFEQLVDALPEQVRAVARGPQKRKFAEQIVNMKIMYAEARKRKLDENPTVQHQLELQKENLLANALYQDMSANVQIDDATAHQYYEQHKADYETAHARHILIRVKGSQPSPPGGKKELTDEEALAKAQEIRKKLIAGEDFAALAKTESDDTRSGANGGDLGSVKRTDQMVPQFLQAVFSLPIGQVSEPIKTQFGYHIIKVESRDARPFEEVKADVEKRMRPELAKSAMENLQKQTPVMIDESFFGPPMPATPPVAARPMAPPPAAAPAAAK